MSISSRGVDPIAPQKRRAPQRTKELEPLSNILTLNDPFTQCLFAAAIVLMVGYGVGRLVNLQRRKAISAWLEPGMRSLGGRPVAQKVDRSSFRFRALQADRPFATVAVTVVLLSREVLPTWLWEMIHRHTDVLVIHVTFRELPAIEADVVDLANELGRRGRSQVVGLGWQDVGQLERWRVYAPQSAQLEPVERLVRAVSKGPFKPWRVAVRRGAPHVLVSMPVPDFKSSRSAELVKWLKDLARVVKPGGS